MNLKFMDVRAHLIGRLVLLTLSAIGLVGCVAPAKKVGGETYGEPPPQVAYMGAVDTQGKHYLTWHRAWAFGPVPNELQASGDINCMRLGSTMRATAYHPRAMDLQGKSTPGGGYFCEPMPLENLINVTPPRAVLQNGALGWDRPGAFGPVPKDKGELAEQACKKGNPKSVPLGFHPKPLDESGQPMAQGGYLCVE
jgi:hypothetical protein